MNGSGSNTSGTHVASTGFWPKGILPLITTTLGNILTDVRKVASGETTALMADFAEMAASDKLSNVTMEEIARRLIITMEQETPGNVIFSPTEPEDKTKAWWQTDAQTGIPLGQPQRWDQNLAKWVPIVDTAAPYVPPARRSIKRLVPAGASAQNFTFDEIGTGAYTAHLTWTTEAAPGSFNAAPGSYPATFGFIVTNKTSNTLTVNCYGVPSGGLTLEGYIEANS